MNDDLLEEEQEQEPVILGDSLAYPFPYVCLQCGHEWDMNFHDIMRLTDKPVMPCGHEWASLDFKRAIRDILPIPAQGSRQSDR